MKPLFYQGVMRMLRALHFIHRFAARCLVLSVILALAAPAYALPSTATDKSTVTKHSVNPPPSADLFYTLTAQYGILSMSGSAQIGWRNRPKQYSIDVVTTATGLGKILETHCEGMVNEYGLAPTQLVETRFRKKPHTVTFDRAKKTIRFSSSPQTYPIIGGEQNRTSITWQLVSMARGAPERMTPGAEWPFFVAGRKNGEVWRFRVIGNETIASPLGEMKALHIAKLPSPSREKQTLDLWLAPSLEWYPVKMVFSDEKGLTLHQVLQSLEKRPTAAVAHVKHTP
jgi:hypothetical protein